MSTAPPMRRRLWFETASAVFTGILAVLTAAVPDWVEAVFGSSPDGDSGSLEWCIVAAFAVTSVVLSATALHEWRRPTRLAVRY